MMMIPTGCSEDKKSICGAMGKECPIMKRIPVCSSSTAIAKKLLPEIEQQRIHSWFSIGAEEGMLSV